MIDMEKFPELKSLNRFIITFFFVLGVTFSMVAPFSVVYAAVNEYYHIDNGPIYTNFAYTGGGYYRQFYSNYELNYINVYFIFSDSNFHNANVLVVSDSPGKFQTGGFASEWNDGGTLYTIDLTYNSDHDLYYWRANTSLQYTSEGNVNYYINQNVNALTDNDLISFVNASGGLTPSINYGDIKDLSYSTNIVGSGTTTGDANIDTITWFPYWDTNDNISTTWNMEIQVVPGTWQGGTNTDIFSQSYQDFIINESGATSIYHGTYLNGSYSISWGEVKNKLSILTWADLFQYFDGTYWNKKGWVYRARFNDPDNDYWSEWQTVYTVTSSAGEGVEKYIDPSDGTGLPDFYNNAIDSYNTTSIVNNINDITYYYVNTPVDTNPSSDDSTKYLKEIRDTIIQIRRMLAIDHNADAIPDNDNDPWSGNPAAELYNFEDNSINDFNDAVNDLPTSDLVTGNKFLAASTWVRTQYETLVSNTPIEAVIIFSLLLGFGLLLIGKLR